MRPSFLDDMSWAMAEVYGSVTDRLLVNLARHFPYIKNADQIRGSFDYQARLLAQMGQVNRESVDIIMQSLGGADAALRASLEAAIMDALKNEESALRKAAQQGLLNGSGMLPAEVTPNQMQAFKAYYRQSADKLNLVNTVMLESTQAAYQATVADVTARIARSQSILNVGAGEVVTGVSAWNTAMREAVGKMVQNGLTGFVDHAGRQWSPEAYVAMDIRTTMFNTAREAISERAQEFGCDLYQVSSHNGARPLCYPWQGKVISRSGWTGTVKDLYGEDITVHSEDEIESFRWGGGLFGVNCRHYPMNFIPGFSTLKGQPQDPEENEQAYAESQQQRALERRLREEKRDLAVMKAQGADEAAIRAQKAKVSRANSELQSFCDENDMPRRRNRESAPVKATWPAEGSYDPKGFPTDEKERIEEWFKNGDPDNPPPQSVHLRPDDIPPMAQQQTPANGKAPEAEPQTQAVQAVKPIQPKKEKTEAQTVYDQIPNGFGNSTKSDRKIKQIIVDFQRKNADSKNESGIVVDEKGNIAKRVLGGKKAVDMVAGKGKLSIHNHPSGSTMFSANDLELIGVDGMNGAKGAVVTTKKGIVIIQTGKDFKGQEFASRFYNQNFKVKWNYASDEQTNEWLINNQGRYNYLYNRIMFDGRRNDDG